MTKQRKRTLGATLVVGMLMCVLAVAPAGAIDWCGENGLIRFSFVEGDTLVSVLEGVEPENGVTVVELHAWLTDVASVARDGEAFLRLGGVELKLTIAGAEAFILEQEFPGEILNVGQAKGELVVGYVPGQRLVDGRAPLVRWKVMFQGPVSDVRFGLAPSGSLTCDGQPDCAASGTPAIYVGVAGSNQLDAMFGAGYVPAWLNPGESPDLTPVTGTQSWQDVGEFSSR